MNPYFLLVPQRQRQLGRFELLSHELKLYQCGLNPKQGLIQDFEVLGHSTHRKLEVQYYLQPLVMLKRLRYEKHQVNFVRLLQ